MKTELIEIKKNHIGTGLLIENDGYITLDDKNNKQIKESFSEVQGWHCPSPFVVHAVFQKYGLKNANGRIYPESVLKKQVQLYQEKINEHRALGECYTSSAKVLCIDGWKNINLLKVGDEVLTLDTNSNQTEYQKISRVFSDSYSGNMIHMLGCGINELVTPNHGYPLYDVRTNEFVGFKTAKQIVDGGISNLESLYIPSNASTIKDGISLSSKYFKGSEQSYTGDIFCIEVPNHTFYVQDNGFKHWSKNCNHPSDSTIDLGRISHNITELHWEGHTLVGTMELNLSQGFISQGICSTLGDTVANLLLNGYKIGVSSRGVGSVEKHLDQYIVGDDFELICWDIVSDPSTPNAWIGSTDEIQQYVENKETNNNTLLEKIHKIKNIL